MATRNSATERRTTDTEHNQLPTQARQQMASLTESAASFYKGLEAVQQVQQHAAQRSALRLQQAAEQLRSSENAAEWMSIQSTLMLSGFQEWTPYVEEMSMTMMRLQANMVSRQDATQAAESAATSAAETSATRHQNAATAASDATLAVLKSWSNMMGGAMAAGDSRASH